MHIGDKVLVSKEIIENIDLEEGKIRVNGKWLTEDEIRYAIKMKVSSDDYNVSDLAVALKTLISEMNKSTVLRIRVPKEMAEEFEELSRNRGESIESLLRDILIEYMGGKGARDETFEEEEETSPHEDAYIGKTEEVYGEENERDEDEPDEDFFDEKEDEEEEEEEIDIGITIGDGDAHEDEITSGLLDLDTVSEDSEAEEVEIEDGMVVEELPDIEVIEEDISQPEIEDIELDEIDSQENLEADDLDDIEDIDEEIDEPQIEESLSEIMESDEDQKEEHIPEIDDNEEEVKKPKGRKIKRALRKKKAARKKVIIRKKKLKNKT